MPATKAATKQTRVLGLNLSESDIEQLHRGESLSLENRSLGEMGRFLQELERKLKTVGKSMSWGEIVSYVGKGKCPGIELVERNQNCSLYWRPLMKFEECCRK